jgi:hypothetical protein
VLERLLNHTGAPDFVWIYAYEYLALVNNWTADRKLRWKTPHAKRFGVTPDISALLTFHFYELIYYLDVEAPAPISREKAGYWLGVAHNVGDALTFKILTNDTETVVYRSVVRSRNDHNGINKRILHNPNLDPDVQQHGNNQNLEYEKKVRFAVYPLELLRTHKRKYKPYKKSRTHHPKAQGRPLTTGPIHPPATMYDPPVTIMPPTTPREVQPSASPTSTARPFQQIGETKGNGVSPRNIEEQNQPESYRRTRSGRQPRPPSRFAQAVTAGLQIGTMFSTGQSFDALVPLMPLPTMTKVPLEQDMTTSSFLTPPEMAKLREMRYLDAMNDPWDPHTAIERILAHRHTRYCRRIPGKHSYSPAVPCITTKGVRIKVEFFNGETGWIPLEVARVENPTVDPGLGTH